MNSVVKNVFLLIMGVVVAMILYLVLFGTQGLNGNSLQNTYTGSIKETHSWQGAIWFMARSVENPISRYYYEYCYLPSMHSNDYVDKALGGTTSSYFGSDTYQSTESNLTGNVDTHNFSTDANITHWSTGWN
jgi:hypothetical protein